MKFLEWPFFLETCLGSCLILSVLETRFEEYCGRNMQHEEYWKRALDVFSWISSRRVPFRLSIRSSLELLKNNPRVEETLRSNLYHTFFFVCSFVCFETVFNDHPHADRRFQFFFLPHLVSFTSNCLRLIQLMSVCLFLLYLISGLLLRCCHSPIKNQSQISKNKNQFEEWFSIKFLLAIGSGIFNERLRDDV